MNYQEAKEKLRGRCRESCKLGNNTYLKRRGKEVQRIRGRLVNVEAIAVQLHSTDVLTFYSDARIEVNTGRWDTVTTRSRINEFLDRPWHVYGERGSTILSNFRWYAGQDGHERRGSVEVVLGSSATILPSGKVKGGESAEEFRAGYRRQDNERRALRNRLRYWIQRAQNNGVVLRRDRSNCINRWCQCHPRHSFHSSRPGQLREAVCSDCGCIGIPRKTTNKLTVTSIMTERNAQIRSAMIHVYGLDRFIVESNAETIDQHGQEYALVRIPNGQGDSIVALKMKCPSTEAVYCSPVPPTCTKVSEALDWMYQTEDYLERLAQAS